MRVHLGLPGFSFANDKGEWSGLDVDYCKALAAAVLGDATKVKYTPTSVRSAGRSCNRARSTCWRHTTITFSRQRHARINFQGINFYEGQLRGAHLRQRQEAADLDGGTVCVAARLDRGEERRRLVHRAPSSRSRSSTSRRTTTRSRPTIPALRMPIRRGVGALAGQRIKLKNRATT